MDIATAKQYKTLSESALLFSHNQVLKHFQYLNGNVQSLVQRKVVPRIETTR